MTSRRVKEVMKDGDGNIIALCNRGKGWSPREKSEAIIDIKSGDYRYFVRDAEDNKVDIEVVTEPYLRTTPDGSLKNNLGDLPECKEEKSW